MKFLKNLNRKKLTKAVAFGLLVSSSVFAGMQQAYANTYITGAERKNVTKIWDDAQWDVWVGDAKKEVKISDKVTTDIATDITSEDYPAISGAYDAKGEASGATVIIENVTFNSFIVGGTGKIAYNNTVNISGAQLQYDSLIRGGYANEKAEGNIVNITNTDTHGVMGAEANFTEVAVANKNIVNINGGTHYSQIFGGASVKSATGNVVNISGSNTIANGVTGGRADASLKLCRFGAAEKNIVNISGGTHNYDIAGGEGYVANKNIVNISGGTFKGEDEDGHPHFAVVFGGISSEIGQTNNNIVNISGGEQNSNIYGSFNFEGGQANKNIVNISGGEQNCDVYGCCVDYGSFEANDNTVNLIGRIGKLEVTKGYNEAGEPVKELVKGNNIKISGTVYGSNLSAGSNAKGNALNVYGMDVNVGNVANFQNMNFYIQDGLSYGDTMLKVTGDKDVDLTNTDVKVEIQAVPKGGKKGVINLIDAPNAKITEAKSKTVEVEQGKTLTFKGKIERQKDDKKLVLVVDELVDPKPDPVPPKPDPVPPKPPVNENGKSLLETRAAAAAVVNASADFMVNQGISQAKAAAMTSNSAMEPFAAMGGSKMRYESGSHIEMNGWNGALGLAKKVKDVTFGVAVEHGKGNYDSYLNNGFHAKGDVKATGGVLFADMQKANGNHFDVAVRAGKVKTDYNNDAGLAYDDSVSYFGAIVGAGHEFKVSEKASLDVYGRYFWNRTADSEVTPDTDKGPGNLTKFDAVNSSRMRIGTRYTQNINEKNQVYAGLAWQYEFNGDARGTIYSGSKGYGCPAPSLKGHSGMAELGYKFEASKNFSVDLNVNGWTGKQKGLAGGLNMQWKF